MMKRLFFVLTLVCSIAFGAAAQSDLKINELFGGKYVSDPGVSEAQMSGNQRYLTQHSLTALAMFKGPADKYASKIQKLVLADGANATTRNVRYRDGRLQYACFALKLPKEGKKQAKRQYIYYFYNAKSNPPTVLLVFMEGYLDAAKAERIFNSYK